MDKLISNTLGNFTMLLVIVIAKRLILRYSTLMSQTYQPNRRKRAKTHGFLSRSKTTKRKKVTQARRRKGRANVSIKK